MPWLDLGDLPSTYSAGKEEAFQVFMEPPSQPPDKMVNQHSEWTDTFNSKYLRKNFELFDFKNRGVSVDDLDDTLVKASQILANYRGKYSKMSRLKNYVCIGLLVVAVLAAVIVGFVNDSIAWPMIILICYMVFCYFAFWFLQN